jgi:site-specific DNA recombinase
VPECREQREVIHNLQDAAGDERCLAKAPGKQHSGERQAYGGRQATRNTGILRNRLYVGEQVWNQRRWLKHPVTARRVAKANSADAVIRQEVAALRIIDDALWGEVEAMLTRLSTRRPEAPEAGTNRFWEQRRARHLLTGKLHCGCCGATLTAIGRDYLACRTAQAAGPCENRGSVRRQTMEARVLEALGSEMMQPELVAEFVASFTAEWNRQQAASRGALETRRRKLQLLERKYDGLVEAIAGGMRTAGLRDKLLGLEAEIAELKSEIDAADQGPAMPGLLGNLADVYRQEVAALREALSADDSPRTLEALRALIDRVEVYPGARRGEPRLELVGKLSAMLELAACERWKGPARCGVGPDMFLGSVKLDAGTGFEPVTFRL